MSDAMALLAHCADNDRICPLPVSWNAPWELLPDRRRVGLGTSAAAHLGGVGTFNQRREAAPPKLELPGVGSAAKWKLTGQKPQLKWRGVSVIGVHPQIFERVWDIAMFNLATDSSC